MGRAGGPGSVRPSHLERVEAWLDVGLSIAAVAVTVAIVALVAVAVLLRYGFNAPLVFSYDVSTMLFAWMIFLGLFIEGTALILILGPMFLPVVLELGIDRVHYGVVFVLMAHLGGITPRVGTVMFTACAVTRLPLVAFARAIWPFILVYIVTAAIVIGFPALSTWLAYA